MSGAAVVGGAGAVVRQGYLRKLKTMKKKYFVLRAETRERSAKLEYYESEKKFRAGAGPKRELSLKSCYNITRRLDLKQKHVIALFTREEQFCVVAENEKDLHEWLTDILRQHRADDASEELLHPIQHVWQVNVQKKGLGASKNIQGLYNLCLTDQTLALVKIKSSNNVISDLGIPERVEYSLKNIRRCGDSECFFYMEVGRQTVTGAGEIWMHSEDSNIAQSMHSTILHKMRNCAKETENDRDHIILPKNMSLSGDDSNPRPRRQTIPHSTGRAGLCNGKGLCVGSCIRQCVCSTATYSIDDSAAAIAPLTPKNAEYEARNTNNPLINGSEGEPRRVVKHHRTVSLPTGCTLHEEPLKIAHERTRSAPLTGDEVATVMIDKVARHSSCKTVNGRESVAFPSKKSPWCRRASTGARLGKLSPAHTKNAGALRNRCDSMPSRFGTAMDIERTQPRHTVMLDGAEGSRDEPDAAGAGAGAVASAGAAAGEWPRAPRIPEEPDYCDMTLRDLLGSSGSGAARGSRGSLLAGEEGAGAGAAALAAGYVPMLPAAEPASASGSGSVCSGTPSTDPRFFEYHLAPATSHIVDAPAERPPRAYSVGSRPGGAPAAPDARLRAYSVGARHRAAPAPAPPPPPPRAPSSAPLLPSASAEDLMELDFSANRPAARAPRPPPPPPPHPLAAPPRDLDEYVDMSPRGAAPAPAPPAAPPRPPEPAPAPAPATRADGYVDMDYSPRPPPTRPIAIAGAGAGAGARAAPGAGGASPPTPRGPRPPLGSQTIFPLSLESPGSPLRASPPPPPPPPSPPAAESSSPPYVRIAGAGAAEAGEAVEAPEATPGPAAAAPGLIYAALDLEPSAAASAAAPRLYTKIDFVRSEKMRSHAHAHAHADANATN